MNLANKTLIDADYLASLNPAQRTAALETEGPVLILAGAGTGKTRVLTTRLAYILQNNLAYPSQILAVTFTNKAAQEMRERISHLLGSPVDNMWIGTFHSLAVRMLRPHAELVGLQRNFTILDSDDQLRLIKQILRAEGIDEQKNPPKLVLSIISRWKDRGLTPEKITSSEQTGSHLLVDVYKQYQERLKILNAADFGDLLLHCLTLFKENPFVLEGYQQQMRYLLVDEYQDTNISQYLWLRLLAQQSQNLCCVGDDDQSIYGWRGAEIGNILKFEKDFPGAKIIRLEQNYRSTPQILGAASGLISKNSSRLGKTLWTNDKAGEKVLIRGTWDSVDEARFIGDEVETLQRQGSPLGSIAILVRASFQTREFEERFLKLGIPYRVIGGPRFYERLEIRDALAYLRLVIQPDDGLAFERIINTPRRGIGTTSIQNIHIIAREQGISLPRAALLFCETGAKGATRTAIHKFFEDIARWRRLLETESHAEVTKIILDESGYTTMWREDKSADAPGRLENLKELVNAIEEFESIPGFLEHVSLVMENNKQSQEDLLSIMTLHSAKGLEFDVVFLPGWEEGLFPHQRALQESGNAGLEEERRLGYVGLSRARRRAIVTYCLQRKMYQGWQMAVPSRFIREIPTEHATLIQPNGNEVDARPSSYSYTPPPAPAHTFKNGDRIFHQKFGYGEIIDIDFDRLEIEFEHTGTKKIAANFVLKA